MRYRLLLAAAMSAALPLSMAVSPAAAWDDEDHRRGGRILSADAKVEGQTVRQWFADYMVHDMETPAAESPYLNPDAPACVESEKDDDVVFMAYAAPGCTIEEDDYLFVSPVGWECSTAEGTLDLHPPYHGRTWKNLRKCVTRMWQKDLAGLPMKMWLDGNRQDIGKTITVTARRVADLPEDNIWAAFYGEPVPAGPTKTLTKGLAIMLHLDEGHHVLKVRPTPGNTLTWHLEVVD